MIGPSENEAFLLFFLPAGISLLLVIFLLFTWRRIKSLAVAVLALCVYGTAGGLAVQSSPVGLVMLLMMAWVTVLFLAAALWISTRPLKVAPAVHPGESGKAGARGTAGSLLVRGLFGVLLVLLACVAAFVALLSFLWSQNAVGSQRFVSLPLCVFSSLLVLASFWCLWRIRVMAVSRQAQMLVVSFSLLFLVYTTTVRW